MPSVVSRQAQKKESFVPRTTVSFAVPLTLLTFLASSTLNISAAQANDPDIAEADIASQIDIDYELFRLDNGLTTIVYTDDSSPTIFVGIWYGVGSKDEPEGRTGFAHLFEHLMFQGTENRDGEYFEPFTKAGATGMNGTTSEDRTNYYATVPTGAIDMALWMESDRMSHLLGAVTQDALDEQRSVVQNEKRSGDNRPYAGVYDRVRAGLYPTDHPYRHSVIGSMEDLDNATVEDVHEWFEKYYGASNAVLVLAGDIDAATAKAKVSHYFSEAPPGVPLVKPQQWIPSLEQNRKEVMYDRVGQVRITRAWPLPNLNERDTTLMYLVNETLVGNKNSPLRKTLVDDLQLATDIRGGARGRIVSGEFGLTINLRPGVDPDEVSKLVDDIMLDYLESGPDADIVENEKLAVNMFMVSSMESKATIGRMLAEGQLYSDDPLFVKKEIEWLNEATPRELTEVARRWLDGAYYELIVLPFPNYTSSDMGVDRSEIPIVDVVSGIEFPDIQTTTLENGMQLIVANSGALPLVDVSFRINSGNTADDANSQGISDAVFALMDKGTNKYSANELASVKDRIAMTTRIRSGVEQSSFNFQILSNYLPDAMDIAAEILQNPTFPDDELEKLRQQVLAYLSNVEQNPAGNATAIYNRSIYGADHPLGAIWSSPLVDQINQERLMAFHQREVTPDNISVYMIGDVQLEEARALLNESFGSWDISHQTARQSIGEALPPRRRVILVDQPDAVQSTIVTGHALSAFDAATDDELSVLNAIFGGDFEARINMNLREDKGWSYGIGSRIQRNSSGDQSIYVAGSVQTDKTAESMAEIKREFEEFVGDRPAEAQELERVKLNRIRSLPGRFETKRGFLQSMMSSNAYGLPYDYAENSAERTESVTLEEVNRRAKELINPNELTWVVVGDLSEIEESVRALGYGEVEVWDGFGNPVR